MNTLMRAMGLCLIVVVGGCSSDAADRKNSQNDPTNLGPNNTLSTLGDTILVATCDSTASAVMQAAFVGDCNGDQEQINQAIAALPEHGGTVQLAAGNYDIRAVSGSLGGVAIDRSNVVLQGVGPATKLRLADAQNVNVIRIGGDGTHDVTVEKLQIDGNRAGNAGVSNFEACGVKTKTTGTTPHKNIVVREIKAYDAFRLNVMLDGNDVKILDNWLGDAGSDVAEVLTGPGLISRNHVEIAGTTGYGLGSDNASGVTIEGNTVTVLEGGQITQAIYRTWQGKYHNVIANNQALVFGSAVRLLEMNGYMNVVQGNVLRTFTGRLQHSDHQRRDGHRQPVRVRGRGDHRHLRRAVARDRHGQLPLPQHDHRSPGDHPRSEQRDVAAVASTLTVEGADGVRHCIDLLRLHLGVHRQRQDAALIALRPPGICVASMPR